jgi:hypothetical protein
MIRSLTRRKRRGMRSLSRFKNFILPLTRAVPEISKF